MLKYAGAGIALVSFIFAMVALCYPVLYYSEKDVSGIGTYKVGIGYYVMWDEQDGTKCGDDGRPECTPLGFSNSCESIGMDQSDTYKDPCAKCIDGGLPAAFFFMIIGVITNFAQMICFVVVDGPAPMALSAITGVFYFFGWVLVTACNDLTDKVSDNSNNSIDYELSVSFGLAVLAWIFNLCTCGVAGYGMTQKPDTQEPAGSADKDPSAVTASV